MRPDGDDDPARSSAGDGPVRRGGLDDEAGRLRLAREVERAVGEGGDGCFGDEGGERVAVDHFGSAEGAEERCRRAMVVLALSLVDEGVAANLSSRSIDCRSATRSNKNE